MRRSVGRVVLLVAFGMCAAGAASAQLTKAVESPSPRQGFWFSIGAAAGSVGMDCSGCGTNRENGPSGTLRLGGTLSPHWLLGGEIDGWGKSKNGLDMTFASAVIVASWYPSRTGGFFLKLGFGGLSYTEDDGTDKTEATGAAGLFGLGFDIPLGRTFALTPYINSIASSNAKVKINGQSVPLVSINPNLVQFGVALSWY